MRHLLAQMTFVLALVFYGLSLFLLKPLGEFAINDDWLFVRQVQAFLIGDFKINAHIDPIFFGQGLLGYVWALVFGASFTSLRVLTFLVSIFLFYGIYKILSLYKLSNGIKFTLLLAFIFNPLIYHLSMTFMTDIYFLTLYVWGIYFYLKYFQSAKLSHFIVGSIFSMLSVFVRQLGILTILCAFVFAKSKKDKAVALIFFAMSLILASWWPKYGVNDGIALNLPTLLQRVPLTLYSGVYFAFFMLPGLVYFKFPLTKVANGLFCMLIVASTWLIYIVDIFPIGNVFYVEGLYLKSDYRFILSIFDNVAFKLLLSAAIAYGVASISTNIKAIFKFNFVFLLMAVNIAILFVSADLYDRYLLVPFVPFYIMVSESLANKANFLNIRVRHISLVASFLLGSLIILAVFLQYDFVQTTKLKWELANKLAQDTGLVTQIQVDDTYFKLMSAVKAQDFTGVGAKASQSENYKCYVQTYTLGEQSLLESYHAKIANLIENPRVYNSKKKSTPRIKNHLADLTHNQQYISVMFNTVGKKAYVGSWCSDSF